MSTPASINTDEVGTFPELIIKVIGIGNDGERILQYVRNKCPYDASFSVITTAPDAEQAQALVSNSRLIFIVLNTADAGDIEAAITIAQIANSFKAQTIAVVALPCSNSISTAGSPLDLTDYTDATIAIELDEADTESNAFENTCCRLYRAIYGIATTGIAHGELPDTSDASMLMPDRGIVRFASVKSTGENRIKVAAEEAIAKLYLPLRDTKYGDDVLIHITSPGRLKLHEISSALAQFPSISPKPIVMSSAAEMSDKLQLTLYATRLLAGLDLIRKDGRENAYIYGFTGGVPFVNFENEGLTLGLYEAVWKRLLESGAHLESITNGKQLLSYFGMTKRERKLLWRLTGAEVLALTINLPEDAELLPAFLGSPQKTENKAR